MLTADAGFDYEAQLFACAAGDESALRRLYDREARWLLGVALRIVVRRELADEVVHDAFLRIWQKSGTYSPALGSARGWIYSVVRHRALDVVRQLRRDPALPGADDAVLDDVADEADDPLQSLSRGRDNSALHLCLQQLDDDKRACILLAYLDGFSQTQIASSLARPLGTIKAWTRRGLLALKDCLS
ncbi:sigma-70 family RNA polymerase sigma factor [Actimicrobium sp. CCC2.4]|uniref:sigma-70 family RNA polymerase sigma factor n=1 Tax=Actimicrobium sp. CCC2.4 TaxID=3048606 RepID=UPI002AC8A668|nr:sigma-70 family RNA polymerase sigma factor [Actimicrobium sp. CCC2.4]MEB0134175.1 sigma-70 family RNA polymerase sigma factor [Actimicrobium sp. CCC2.4]WPX32830.1 sigma-70 family RNA polymerase sigma factor [Actimicrobium sp. CCC2.4]